MKTIEEITELTALVVCDELGIKADQISFDDDISDEFGADSLNYYSIMMLLEGEFHISIPDDTICELSTINKMSKYIFEHQRND